MEHFPLPEVSAEALRRFFLPDGLPPGKGYKLLPMWQQNVSRAREQITMLASFVEVHLAKEGHDGLVGVNLLTKVQMPNLATLYGAMLAGVDYVLMGAGIPREIPGVLDAFAAKLPGRIKLDVEGLPRGESADLHLDPAAHFEGAPPELKRPRFLPIISSHSLAAMLLKKATGVIDGFIVEGPTAGGHNAPPRGAIQYNERGEPIYGERDEANFEEIGSHGLPYWIAGGAASPEYLAEAVAKGAAGVQVGTLFAYANESGLDPALRRQVLETVRNGEVDVRTDAKASPTGFPFKVVELEGTNSMPVLYEQRERICDLGYLRTAYADGSRIKYRCPSEPVGTYVAKGGTVEETQGRKCLCNALMANVGHAQVREDGPERALLTSGDDFSPVRRMLQDRDEYSADDAIDHLLSGILATTV
jgi:NAD(P)H-dependent flavin oxidoreductase YrpB (nitropropane dioxygenase family)